VWDGSRAGAKSAPFNLFPLEQTNPYAKLNPYNKQGWRKLRNVFRVKSDMSQVTSASALFKWLLSKP
jgi:hypothetical protein